MPRDLGKVSILRRKLIGKVSILPLKHIGKVSILPLKPIGKVSILPLKPIGKVSEYLGLRQSKSAWSGLCTSVYMATFVRRDDSAPEYYRVSLEGLARGRIPPSWD